MSDLGFFRNVYKNPDEYKIGGYDADRREIEEERKRDSLDKKNKKKVRPETKEIISPLVANYEKVVGAIANFELKPAFQENMAEAEILKKRKK